MTFSDYANSNGLGPAELVRKKKVLMGIAPFIDPHLTGLLTTIWLYASIMTIFAHHHQGPAAAAHVLRGLLYGLFAFAGFESIT